MKVARELISCRSPVVCTVQYQMKKSASSGCMGKCDAIDPGGGRRIISSHSARSSVYGPPRLLTCYSPETSVWRRSAVVKMSSVVHLLHPWFGQALPLVEVVGYSLNVLYFLIIILPDIIFLVESPIYMYVHSNDLVWLWVWWRVWCRVWWRVWWRVLLRVWWSVSPDQSI